MFLGIRSPLRLDVGLIKRTRPVYVRKVLFPMISVEAIDVVEEKIEENVIRKWIFPFKVRSYSYTPAPSCIDTTQQWLVSAYNQDQLTKELTRKEAQLLESKTSAMSTFYAKSADPLVEMISDRTPGAEIYNEVAERLSPYDERQQRPHHIEENQTSEEERHLQEEGEGGGGMKLSFIGDSDDIRLIYDDRGELMDISDFYNRSVIKISKGDEGFFVVFHYDGMWSMSIRQLDDGVPISDWLTYVSVNYDEMWPILATLTIEVPDDVEIKGVFE